MAVAFTNSLSLYSLGKQVVGLGPASCPLFRCCVHEIRVNVPHLTPGYFLWCCLQLLQVVVRGGSSPQAVNQLLTQLGSDAATQTSFLSVLQAGPATISGMQVVQVVQGLATSSSAPAGRAPVISLIGPNPDTVNAYTTYSDPGNS